MADVTVNIKGNASQLKEELNSVAKNAGDSTQTQQSQQNVDSRMIPKSESMIEEIKSRMEEHGVVLAKNSIDSINNIISEYESEIKEAIKNRITGEFDERRKKGSELIEEKAEEARKHYLEQVKTKYGEEEYNKFIADENKYSGLRLINSSSLYSILESISRKFDHLVEFDDEENSEINKKNEELKNAIDELKKFFEDEAEETESEKISYVGGLRAKQKELIQIRDSAETQEDAMAASKDLAKVNEELRNVLNGGAPKQDGDVEKKTAIGLGILHGGLGAINMVDSLQNGNFSGALMGGAMMTKNPYIIASGAIIGTFQKFADSVSQLYETLTPLASFRSTADGYRGGDASEYLNAILPTSKYKNLVDYNDFGMDTDEFSSEAVRRIKARGMTDDWFNQTIGQIALERNLAMDSGSLQRGSQYDRYGINVTDAISRMVTFLLGIQGSGVSLNDFTRVQEKYDIQQQLMASYMSRTDRPNYDVANSTLAAFSAVKGITQDSRIGSDIASFQNMIQNPMNDRMRALIYGSVADLFPETGGRMDLIDREIRNPENEGKIMQAVIERITKQFGGTDTQMGYFAFKSLLPGIAPDRLDEYISQFSKGDDTLAGSLLSEVYGRSGESYAKSDTNKDFWIQQASEFTTTWTKGKNEVITVLKSILSHMGGTSSFTPGPRRGGRE